MSRWDELHQVTVRASAFLTTRLLPVMVGNDFGIIANTVAPEGLSYGAYFAAAMAGQRSMVLSLASELGNDSKVHVFGFAPGLVDTPLVAENAPYYPDLLGMSQAEYFAKFVHNPGYDGLVPAEDCGASYVYCLAHAKEFHGQITDAFHALIRYGIVTPREARDEPARASDNFDLSTRDLDNYIEGISSVNRNLERRIEERTRDLETANRQLASQKRLIEEISSKISRYLPQQICQSIFSGKMDAEITSRRKHLTIFFSDIRDFVRRTERLEPEALSAILNSYFSAMTEIAKAHGATIDKFIGDAILMFFGDPESLGAEKDAERCVQMAVDMQRRMVELEPEFVRLGLHEPLEIRIGINSGYCTVGNFGSYDRMDYTIVGSPVNIAARLQGICEPNAILTSRSTQILVADSFRFEPRGEHDLKGIIDKIEAFEVIFDADTPSEGGIGQSDPLASIKAHLSQIDIDKLGDEEREDLLSTMSKLLKG